MFAGKLARGGPAREAVNLPGRNVGPARDVQRFNPALASEPPAGDRGDPGVPAKHFERENAAGGTAAIALVWHNFS